MKNCKQSPFVREFSLREAPSTLPVPISTAYNEVRISENQAGGFEEKQRIFLSTIESAANDLAKRGVDIALGTRRRGETIEIAIRICSQ